MKNILFPTEFSNHASQVLQYASDLAYFFKARLIVMNAYGKPESEFTTDKELKRMAHIVSMELAGFVEKYLPNDYRENIEVDYISQVGFPSEAILKVALEENIDLIVMGMTGKTNTLDTLLGATSFEVMSKSNCPVLMIPVSAKWEGIDNMVYTANLHLNDTAALKYIEKWSEALDTPIHCLHVIGNNGIEFNAKKAFEKLEQPFQKENWISFHLLKGKLEHEVEKFAKSVRADMIVMLAHKGNFISRLLQNDDVKEIARHTKIPLLVLKEKK